MSNKRALYEEAFALLKRAQELLRAVSANRQQAASKKAA